MASLPDLEPRPFSVAEYHQMVDAGILPEDERVELLEGVIVAVSLQKRRHSFVIERLNEILVGQLAGRYRVLPQLPLTLGDDSEPEPDLAVVARDEGSSRTEHPRRALLVIEISGDSLLSDRLVKGRIYARAAIPEYWLFNLDEGCVEVRRDPDPSTGTYGTRLPVPADGDLRSTAVPGLVVALRGLLD